MIEQRRDEVLPLMAKVTLGDVPVTFRYVEPTDGPAILEFARALPSHDLLFLRRDITDPQQVEIWLSEAARGLSTTILAVADSKIVGYANVASEGLAWTRHVRELRVVVAESMRGKQLGGLLIEQAFAVAKQHGVKKMMAQMTTDQEAAFRIFRGFGFEPEALLRNQVMDRDGELRDLQVMSLDVDAFQARLNAAIRFRTASTPDA